MTETWKVLEGFGSWHQQRAGHTSNAATVGFKSREDAEAFAAGCREQHPGKPKDYYRVVPELARRVPPKEAALDALRIAYAYSRAHSKLCAWADRRYGEGNGQVISGGHREHFPSAVKDTLRHLARGVSLAMDESRRLWRLAGKRRVTWLRAKDAVAKRDGRGFYG